VILICDLESQITNRKSEVPMSDLIALDVAVLPPPDVADKAIALSAALPEAESPPLRLDADHLPHITLMQLFARVNELDLVMSKVDEAVRGVGPLALPVAGGGQATNAVWMAIEKTPPLVELHERLMEALRGVERPDGGTGAFFGDDARLRDVLWVAGYRLKSSFHHFEPHITLGHGSEPPRVEPFAFEADTVAVCHLGRYCTCRRVLRQWTLTA
jgi:2'-5' RNA ligase